MPTIRVSTFNCENLFSRATILNFDNKQAAGPLTKLAELDAILAKPQYTAADKTKILRLTDELAAFIDLTELRSKLLGTSKGKKIVKVNGRSEWVGGIRLKRDSLPTAAQENTARVVEAVGADVQALVEVEDRQVLEDFNNRWLKNKPFGFNMIIRGNDARGINVGVFSKLPLLDLRTHIFDADPAGRRIFSRDCLEVMLKLPDGRVLGLLVNHFKSQGYGSQASNDAKRKAQADRVAELLAARYDLDKDLVIVAGDFNDEPASAPLQGLLSTADLTDVLAWKFNDPADRWTYHYKTTKSQIDYLLVANSLKSRLADAGVERRGLFPAAKLGVPDPFPTVTSDTDDASDHAAVWAEFDL